VGEFFSFLIVKTSIRTSYRSTGPFVFGPLLRKNPSLPKLLPMVSTKCSQNQKASLKLPDGLLLSRVCDIPIYSCPVRSTPLYISDIFPYACFFFLQRFMGR